MMSHPGITGEEKDELVKEKYQSLPGQYQG